MTVQKGNWGDYIVVDLSGPQWDKDRVLGIFSTLEEAREEAQIYSAGGRIGVARIQQVSP